MGLNAQVRAPAPFDACPDCRADRACPADVWPHALAAAFTDGGRNLNRRSAMGWTGHTGRLAELAQPGQTAVAAHAAWLVARVLAEKQPADADKVAALAESLGLLAPRLVHRTTTALAVHDVAAALATADAALARRDGSTDRAWESLAAYRDALAARQAAAARTRPERPHRVGHSATSRPIRRRFTAFER